MTSHELARRLLALPDRPVIYSDGCCGYNRVYDAQPGESKPLFNPDDCVPSEVILLRDGTKGAGDAYDVHCWSDWPCELAERLERAARAYWHYPQADTEADSLDAVLEEVAAARARGEIPQRQK